MFQMLLTETKRDIIIKSIDPFFIGKVVDMLENRMLIELRGDRTRVDIANDLGITQQGLGMIERGERTPRPELMKRIADYYNKTVDELFFSHERHNLCQDQEKPHHAV